MLFKVRSSHRTDKKHLLCPRNRHGSAAGLPALSPPDDGAGDHVLRSLVLPEVRGRLLPPVQVPGVQSEAEAEGSPGDEEQRPAHQCGGEVLSRGEQAQKSRPGQAPNQRVHRGAADHHRGSAHG